MLKEEAIKRVKGYLTDYLPADCYGEIEEIIDALEQEPTWTPVSKELPKKGGDYLVTISFDVGAEEPVREVYKGFFCELSQKWLHNDDNIIAWMPLPQTYKADKRGNAKK